MRRAAPPEEWKPAEGRSKGGFAALGVSVRSVRSHFLSSQSSPMQASGEMSGVALQDEGAQFFHRDTGAGLHCS